MKYNSQKRRAIDICIILILLGGLLPLDNCQKRTTSILKETYNHEVIFKGKSGQGTSDLLFDYVVYEENGEFYQVTPNTFTISYDGDFYINNEAKREIKQFSPTGTFMKIIDYPNDYEIVDMVITDAGEIILDVLFTGIFIIRNTEIIKNIPYLTLEQERELVSTGPLFYYNNYCYVSRDSAEYSGVAFRIDLNTGSVVRNSKGSVWAASGGLYGSDQSTYFTELQITNKDGEHFIKKPDRIARAIEPIGIDSNDNLYVVFDTGSEDNSIATVRKYSPQGYRLAEFTVVNYARQNLSGSLRYIKLDKNGNIYIFNVPDTGPISEPGYFQTWEMHKYFKVE